MASYKAELEATKKALAEAAETTQGALALYRERVLFLEGDNGRLRGDVATLQQKLRQAEGERDTFRMLQTRANDQTIKMIGMQGGTMEAFKALVEGMRAQR